MAAIRVQAPHGHAGKILFMILLGVLCGVLFWPMKGALNPILCGLSARYGIGVRVAVEIALTILVPVFVTLYWSGVCQHPRATLWGCFLFVVSFVAAIETPRVWHRSVQAQEFLILAIAAPLLGSVCGIVGLVVRSIWMRTIYRIVPQDGYLCWQCAFDLRGQTESRCLECGTAYDADELKRFRSAAGS